MSFDLKIENGDLVIGSNGDVVTVEGSDKLVQDILKIISTPIGANPFFPWYGCPITRSLVGTGYDRKFIAALATQQLRASLETLQRLQKEQMREYQLVSPQEQLAAIEKVVVDRSIDDPRFFAILVSVLNKSFRRVQTSLEIGL